nr:uroporphyrinogen decarboxylase family protein [Candidatus Calescibacterium sp.]
MSVLMTPKERFYACLDGAVTNKVPVLAYHFLLPRGELERRLREVGCGLLVGVPVYELVFPPQIILEEVHRWNHGEKVIVRTYNTPLGSLREVVTLSPYGSEWRREHLIQCAEDYKILVYLLENVTFKEKIEDFVFAQSEIGDDGIVVPMLPLFERSPFQKALVDLAGPERLLLDLYDRPQHVEALITCLTERFEEALRIYRMLPERRIFWWVDNVTADFTTPQLFRSFCLPIYERYLAPLREEGIICMVHLDGKLKALCELIRKAPIDVVESFTLPEQGGDLSLEEAHSVWSDKVIAANIPANLAYREREEIAVFFRDLLERRCVKGKFILELSEDVPRESLPKVMATLYDVLREGGF